MPMIGPEFETIQKAGRMQTAEPSSLKTSALETASSGASPQKQRGHSEMLDRLATGAAKPELSMEVSSAKRKPKQLDYDVNCPHCGRVNPYDYSSCDPVLPRICQGDEEIMKEAKPAESEVQAKSQADTLEDIQRSMTPILL